VRSAASRPSDRRARPPASRAASRRRICPAGEAQRRRAAGAAEHGVEQEVDRVQAGQLPGAHWTRAPTSSSAVAASTRRSLLGPLLHEFGWTQTDYDLLSAGTLVGHIVECSPQTTAACTPTGGRCPAGTTSASRCRGERRRQRGDHQAHGHRRPGVAGDRGRADPLRDRRPGSLVMPDVVCDWRDVRVEQEGHDRVSVSGARGSAPTRTSAVVAEGPRCWVTAPAKGPLPGYVCVVSRTHVVEPFDLPQEHQAAFWLDVCSVAQARSARRRRGRPGSQGFHRSPAELRRGSVSRPNGTRRVGPGPEAIPQVTAPGGCPYLLHRPTATSGHSETTSARIGEDRPLSDMAGYADNVTISYEAAAYPKLLPSGRGRPWTIAPRRSPVRAGSLHRR